jgi:hypothetical protein
MTDTMRTAPAATDGSDVQPSWDRSERPSRAFGWTALALAAWLVAGAYLDAWAHTNIANLETFFTPWHAVLYSGWFANAAFLGWSWYRGIREGRSARDALPAGYGLSLLGCVTFAVGGALDLTWHLIFGIERQFSALTSPTHLILIASAGLIVSGGLRASWARGETDAGYVAVLSATLLTAILGFWGQFDHPFTSQYAAGRITPGQLTETYEELGVLAVVLHTAFLSGVVLSMVRRQQLPLFALTILMGVTGALITLIDEPDPVIVVGLIGGLWADAVYAVLRPSDPRRTHLRIFAFMLPLGLWTAYFLGLRSADGIWWPIHVWTGTIVIAAATSCILSYGIVPEDRVVAIRG